MLWLEANDATARTTSTRCRVCSDRLTHFRFCRLILMTVCSVSLISYDSVTSWILLLPLLFLNEQFLYGTGSGSTSPLLLLLPLRHRPAPAATSSTTPACCCCRFLYGTGPLLLPLPLWHRPAAAAASSTAPPCSYCRLSSRYSLFSRSSFSAIKPRALWALRFSNMDPVSSWSTISADRERRWGKGCLPSWLHWRHLAVQVDTVPMVA